MAKSAASSSSTTSSSSCEFVKGLNAAARTLDNPLGITFTGVTTAKEALQVLEADGNLQAVLVDDTLYTLGSNSKKKLQMSALELVQRITRSRPEVDVYIVIAQEKEDDVVDALFAESVDGYFYREERDYRGMYRILNAQIQERARTPFYDQLKTYVWMAKDQWHTPGHSSGEAARQPVGQRFLRVHGRARVRRRSLGLRADARLAHGAERRDRRGAGDGGQGFRREAHLLRDQRHVNREQGHFPDPARARRRSCSSTAIATRACTTAWCSPARTIYLDSALNKKYGLYGPVPKKALFEAIRKHADAQALILTSCTYDGLRYDLPPIIEAAHQRGIKVIIDEAWYGFARFIPGSARPRSKLAPTTPRSRPTKCSRRSRRLR